MAKSPESQPGLSTEKAAKFYRNFNIVSATATGVGIFIFPEKALAFTGLTAFNIAQAGIAEVIRRQSQNQSTPDHKQTLLPSAA